MNSADDTQPRSPFRPPAQKRKTQESKGIRPPVGAAYLGDSASGPGCVGWLLLGLVGLSCSLLIVVLAAAAGWVEGQRVADRNATATQAEFVNEQLRRIPTDVANGNQILLATRVSFLAQLTPGVPAVPHLQATVTALYLNNLPTATPEASPTPAPALTTIPEQTDTAIEPIIQANGSVTYDLDTLLNEAQLHVRFAEYSQAYEKLDAIVRIDPTYQRATVRALMLQVLTIQAQQLYRSPDPTDLAEAIRLTDLAEQYGSVGDLAYERLIASYYLDIERAIATNNYLSAIALLNEVMSYQTTYKGIDFRALLFNEYVAYGDAWDLGGDPCQAVTHYDFALSLYANASVRQKRDDAQTACEQITPTPADPAYMTYPGVPPSATP